MLLPPLRRGAAPPLPSGDSPRRWRQARERRPGKPPRRRTPGGL